MDYTDWWAMQEAARQCVAVRLRTHVGGPTQTFAALEKSLLAVNSSLRNGIALQGIPPPQPQLGVLLNSFTCGDKPSTLTISHQRLSAAARADGQQADESWSRLLLEFMGALERGLFAAHSGSSLRARVPDEAAAFFVQNRKVRCCMWYRPCLCRVDTSPPSNIKSHLPSGSNAMNRCDGEGCKQLSRVAEP